MLVSSIARFNAVNTMNNAAFASMQASNSMMNAVKNAGTFGGEHDFCMLNEIDKKLTFDLLSSNLLYKTACMQEQAAQKNSSLNILA